MDAMDYLRLHGAATAREMRRQGCSGIERAQRECPHAGSALYVDGAEPELVRARQYNALITCVSAVRILGLALLRDPVSVHLAIPHSRHVRVSRARPGHGVVLHREAFVPKEGPVPHVAEPAAAIARALTCLEGAEAVAMLDQALHRQLVASSDIRIPSSGPHAPLVREALLLSRPRARSLLETIARLRLRKAGIEAEVGVLIRGVGEVDLLIDGALVVELDGWQFHASREQRHKDLARDRALLARGFLVMRYGYHDIVDADDFLDEVRHMRSRAAVYRASMG